jgi:hypothetical protein
MKTTLVRYKTKPDRTEENAQLIKAVFAELHAKAPEGVHYAALKLADGSFVHVVRSDTDPSPLPKLEAFQAFLGGIRERCSEPPAQNEVTVVGNYRLIGPS